METAIPSFPVDLPSASSAFIGTASNVVDRTNIPASTSADFTRLVRI